jgi:hypothetical protein
MLQWAGVRNVALALAAAPDSPSSGGVLKQAYRAKTAQKTADSKAQQG